MAKRKLSQADFANSGSATRGTLMKSRRETAPQPPKGPVSPRRVGGGTPRPGKLAK